MAQYTVQTGRDNKQYKVSGGTWYHIDTADDVIGLLDKLRANRRVVRVYQGDTETGVPWDEENDVVGKIGRSTGDIKIPLLVPEDDDGGPGLLEHCIVAVQAKHSEDFLYKHPKFHFPEWKLDVCPEKVGDSDMKADGYRWGAYKRRGEGWENVANFKWKEAAKSYIDFMTGKRTTQVEDKDTEDRVKGAIEEVIDRQLNDRVMEKVTSIMRRGGIDFDQFEEAEGALAKIILYVTFRELANDYLPLTREYKEIAANLILL